MIVDEGLTFTRSSTGFGRRRRFHDDVPSSLVPNKSQATATLSRHKKKKNKEPSIFIIFFLAFIVLAFRTSRGGNENCEPINAFEILFKSPGAQYL
jgi:hypothetical protein